MQNTFSFTTERSCSIKCNRMFVHVYGALWRKKFAHCLSQSKGIMWICKFWREQLTGTASQAPAYWWWNSDHLSRRLPSTSASLLAGTLPKTLPCRTNAPISQLKNNNFTVKRVVYILLQVLNTQYKLLSTNDGLFLKNFSICILGVFKNIHYAVYHTGVRCPTMTPNKRRPNAKSK